jgi:hypothetical protein
MVYTTTQHERDEDRLRPAVEPFDTGAALVGR